MLILLDGKAFLLHVETLEQYNRYELNHKNVLYNFP